MCIQAEVPSPGFEHSTFTLVAFTVKSDALGQVPNFEPGHLFNLDWVSFHLCIVTLYRVTAFHMPGVNI